MTSISDLDYALLLEQQAEDSPSYEVKDMAQTLMKGASTVGTIFNSNTVKDDLLIFDSIEDLGDSTFKIKGVGVVTEADGIFYLVVNVRGVESDYTHSQAQITIKEKQTVFTYIFRMFEGFIAFSIATTIIVSASYSFPWYLLPFSYGAMIAFGIYVYGERNKGLTFMILIYSFMGVLAVLIGGLVVLKMCYRK